MTGKDLLALTGALPVLDARGKGRGTVVFLTVVFLPLVSAACGQPTLDHFAVYRVDAVETNFQVRLTDQFDLDSKEARLDSLTHFANPTRKIHGATQVGVSDADGHLHWYSLSQPLVEPRRTVRFLNQFGQHSVDTGQPRFLLVPAQKTSHQGSEFPDALGHYKCYEVIQVNVVPAMPAVMLGDQFGSTQNVQVGGPRLFCLPVAKVWEGQESPILNADDHLAVYDVPFQTQEEGVTTRDQFGERELRVIQSALLAIPTDKQAVATHDN